MIQERGEGARPLVLYQRGQEGGKSSRPFHKIYLFKHEQALAEVIIDHMCEGCVIARTENLRL